jgi:hypothetical protein
MLPAAIATLRSTRCINLRNRDPDMGSADLPPVVVGLPVRAGYALYGPCRFDVVTQASKDEGVFAGAAHWLTGIGIPGALFAAVFGVAYGKNAEGATVTVMPACVGRGSAGRTAQMSIGFGGRPRRRR